MVLHREASKKSFSTYRKPPPPPALLSGGTVITISNDSSRSDSSTKSNPGSSSIAKFTYRTLGKDLTTALGYSKSHKKSHLKATNVDSACD